MPHTLDSPTSSPQRTAGSSSAPGGRISTAVNDLAGRLLGPIALLFQGFDEALLPVSEPDDEVAEIEAWLAERAAASDPGH